MNRHLLGITRLILLVFSGNNFAGSPDPAVNWVLGN